jgi:hypothetical protein
MEIYHIDEFLNVMNAKAERDEHCDAHNTV